MSKLIIDFKHDDVMQPKPWPVAINDDNKVTSGLGNDDGATWNGFARKGEMGFFAAPTDFATIDFEAEDIVPVFTKDDVMFNWDIPIRAIRAEAVTA